MYMNFYRNFGKLFENMYELCIKGIVLLDFNEILHFALIPLLIVVRKNSFMSL